MNDISNDLEILEYLFQTRLNHLDISWQLFSEKYRKWVINSLTAEEIKEGNPKVYQDIVTNVVSELSERLTNPTPAQREDKMTARTPRVYKRRREACVGDLIIFEGIQFVVVGWKGTQLMVKDQHGNQGLIPNDQSKYQVIRKNQ